MVLLVLSVAAVLGAPGSPFDKPDSMGVGREVSAYVHELLQEKHDTPETDPLPDPSPSPLPEDDPVTEVAGTRGACVAAVAHSDAVGGPNNNHGGAVSDAARTTCRTGADDVEDTDATDEDADEDDTDADVTDADKAAKEAAKADKQQAKDAEKAAKHGGKVDKHGANGRGPGKSR
jgi:hypothetical protein